MKLKCPWLLRTVLELVFLIIVQATGYSLSHVSCQSLLIDVNSKVYEFGLKSVFISCLHLNLGLSQVIKSDECDIAMLKDH